jgi:hypothetical protein
MKLAIMQPYFFPYLGYWQLIYAVDKFIIFDDVNYSKGGWINRNRILINGEPKFITVPLDKASRLKKINCTSLITSSSWREGLVKKIYYSYRSSPFYSDIFPTIEELILFEESNLSVYLTYQIKGLSTLLGLTADIFLASEMDSSQQLSGQDRILNICLQEKASSYVNLRGGIGLYDPKIFQLNGINLKFHHMNEIQYLQRSTRFFPSLSIIDVLMQIGLSEARKLLPNFSIN